MVVKDRHGRLEPWRLNHKAGSRKTPDGAPLRTPTAPSLNGLTTGVTHPESRRPTASPHTMAFADWPAGLRWSAVRLPPLLVLLVAFVTLLTTGLVSKVLCPRATPRHPRASAAHHHRCPPACGRRPQARNDPWGGLPAPYISDTAKTPPNWIVFAVGFTIAAALYDYVATAYALALRRRRGAEDAVTGRVALAAVVVAQPAVLGQALLAILNTQDFPTAHLAFALLFFIFVIVWIALDLVLTRRWERAEGAARPRLRRMFLYKAVVASLAFLAFILYIPVGLSVISSTRHACS